MNTSGSIDRTALRHVAILSSVILIYVVLCLSIFKFVVDDAYISFLYTRNLVSLHQLTPSPGNYVQGFTNLLFVLLVSLFYWLVGPDALETVVKVFLILCGGATVWILAATLSRLRAGAAITWFCSACVSTSTPFVLWTMGSLETVLLALIVSLLVYVYLIHPDAVSLLLSLILLAVLTRLDSIVFASPLLFSVLFFDSAARAENGLRNRLVVAVAKLSVILVIPLACVLLWQRFYFGTVMPSSFSVKAARSVPELLTRAVSSGIPYFVDFLLLNSHWLAFAAILLFAWRSARKSADTSDADLQRRLLCVALGLVLYWWYFITQGNLHMSFAFRFFVPSIPVLLLFLGIELGGLLAFVKRSRLARIACCVLAAIVLGNNVRIFYEAYTDSMLFTANPRGDYAGVPNASARGWILLYENWKNAAKKFAKLVKPPAIVYVSDMAGIFPFFLQVPAFDGKLIGVSRDGHYDYIIDRCRCTGNPPQGVLRVGKGGIGFPATLAPQSCFCLLPFQLREDFYRWNNCEPGGNSIRCILEGDLKDVRSMFDRGVDPENLGQEGMTLLGYAANLGNLNIVELLLARGARVNKLDATGHTALHWAVWRGKKDMVQTLLDHGADVDLTATPFKPLLFAKLRRNRAMEELLRKYGAQSYFSTGGLRTALTLRILATVGVTLMLLGLLAIIPCLVAKKLFVSFPISSARPADGRPPIDSNQQA